MTKLANGVRGLASTATALGVGQYALRVSRQLAGARDRLSAKALFRSDVALTGFAQPIGTDPWHADAPLPEVALHHARDFMRLLPSTLPEPRVTRADDGGLIFEWTGEAHRWLKVGINIDGMIVYTARLGLRRRVSGAEPLGESLSPMIREAIQQVSG
ncbi:MAG: hypothetical protein ACK5PW_01305 [Burkholderiales bacterium]|jgi:hypothetical protein